MLIMVFLLFIANERSIRTQTIPNEEFFKYTQSGLILCQMQTEFIDLLRAPPMEANTPSGSSTNKVIHID